MLPSRSRPSELLGWTLAAALLLAAPGAARAASPAAPAAAAVPLPADEARQQALDRVSVGMRFEIQEQLLAAERALRAAEEARAQLVPVQRELGRHLLRRGEAAQAAVAFGAMTRLDPYGSEGYALLGLAMALQGQAGAANQLGKGLEMDARAADARLPAADLLRSAGQLDLVELALSQIAPEYGKLPEVQLAWARLHLLRGEDDRAMARIDQLLGAAPDDGVLALRAAELLLSERRCPAALARLQEEARKRPRPESLRSLGWGLLLCTTEPLRAAGAFYAATKKDGADDGAKIGLAYALMATEGQAEALPTAARYLDDVLRRDPSHAGALLARARLAMIQKNPTEATALLQRIPASHPATAEAECLRARMAVDREDPYGALSVLKAQIQRTPDRLHLRLDLALAYLRAGRSTDAKAVVDEALRSLPADAPLRAHAAALFESRRRPQ